jgi:tRNA U54 and U55 pseudouridine synthase Pus10
LFFRGWLEERTYISCLNLFLHTTEIRKLAEETIGKFQFKEIQIELNKVIEKSDKKIIDEFFLQESCTIKSYLKAELCVNSKHSNEGPILIIIKSPTDYKCTLQWPLVYISGRYFKYARDVSHSKFYKDLSIASVERELIQSISTTFQFTDIKFQSAGIKIWKDFCKTLAQKVN